MVLGAVAGEKNILELKSKVPLPDVKGRFDHMAIDSKGARLFVAALGNNTLEVIDLREGKRLKSISGMSKPTGVCFLPEKNWIGVANGDKGTFELIDGRTYKVVKTIENLDDADNVRFDPRRNLIYVGFGSGALAVINPETMSKTAEIKLKAHPESFQLEPGGARIFVNIPEARQIAVLDRDKRVVLSEWPLTDYKANFPMALDEPNHRLFVGCRNPAQLLVLDSKTGKQISRCNISGDTDDLFYDPHQRNVLVSCGEGKIDIAHQVTPDKFEILQSVPTSPGARTSFFSSDLNIFALAVPTRGNIQSAIWIYDIPN